MSPSSPTPYYQQDGITIYHGDCRDILPILKADTLITDPPYGVGLGIAKDMRANGHGLAKTAYASYDDTHESLIQVVAPALSAALAIVRRGAVFSGPHLWDFPPADALGGIYCPAGAGRHRWGFKTFLPVLFYGTAPNLHLGAKPIVLQSSARAEQNGHPCPKPLEWMRWLVGLASAPPDLILDPFMGSGTTLVAAKDLGRQAIGIELEERYCEIAAKRLQQSVLPLEVASCG